MIKVVIPSGTGKVCTWEWGVCWLDMQVRARLKAGCTRETGAMCALRIEEHIHIGLPDAINPEGKSWYGLIFLVAVENHISCGTF